MDNIVEFACKFILCVLLTQFGKTFAAIERINAELNNDDEQGRSIHMIFTMNTLLNNKQFANRLKNLENKYGKGSVCIFSSSYEGNYRHVKSYLELLGICMDISTCPRLVLMCSNKRRYEDGVKFLQVIDKNKGHIVRAFTYYDELHQYISDILRGQIETIHNLEIIKGITALTATPDKIWLKQDKFWGRIKLIDLRSFNDSNYVGYKDMNFICVDDFFENPYIRPGLFDFDTKDNETIGFIHRVLGKYPEILNDNSRSFIPAHVRRIGHNEVRELIFKLNNRSVVVVINGIEKHLQYIDYDDNIRTLPLTSEDEEVCETISRLVIDNNLQNRPLIITGYLCVGMGQTLSHMNLGSFTSAIFGHLDLTNDEIYQLFGRITGRMKHWGDKYVRANVYCTTTVMNRCIAMEECARNMAIELNGEVVTQEDYREPMSKMGESGKSAIDNIRNQKERKNIKKTADDRDKSHKTFCTQKEALDYGKAVLDIKFNKRDKHIAPKELLHNGRNPSSTEIFKRMWGINPQNPARMVAISHPTKKWCVYWRPSLIKNTRQQLS